MVMFDTISIRKGQLRNKSYAFEKVVEHPHRIAPPVRHSDSPNTTGRHVRTFGSLQVEFDGSSLLLPQKLSFSATCSVRGLFCELKPSSYPCTKSSPSRSASSSSCALRRTASSTIRSSATREPLHRGPQGPPWWGLPRLATSQTPAPTGTSRSAGSCSFKIAVSDGATPSYAWGVPV